MSAALRRRAAGLGVDVVVALMAAVVYASIWPISGRIAEAGGLGYDGQVYARMVVRGLDYGAGNARLRPLVLLINQLVYDFVSHDVLRAFEIMNAVYLVGLAFVLARILSFYRAGTAHKFIVVLNAFATIAVVKMFAYYPVLVDAGAYLFLSLAVYAALRGGRVTTMMAMLLAVFAREFGLVAVAFGVHRDARRRVPVWQIAVTYLPPIIGFYLMRRWVVATSPVGNESSALSVADVIANVRFLIDPAFLLYFAYFVVTVFGGVSFLLVVAALRGRARLDHETEWLTFIAATLALAVLGNADVWRYLAYGLPAVVALYALSFGRGTWHELLPWCALITVFTQQPWTEITAVTYFEDWFPLYLPIESAPGSLTPLFWIKWAVRIVGVTVFAFGLWRSWRPRVTGVDDTASRLSPQSV